MLERIADELIERNKRKKEVLWFEGVVKKERILILSNAIFSHLKRGLDKSRVLDLFLKDSSIEKILKVLKIKKSDPQEISQFYTLYYLVCLTLLKSKNYKELLDDFVKYRSVVRKTASESIKEYIPLLSDVITDFNEEKFLPIANQWLGHKEPREEEKEEEEKEEKKAEEIENAEVFAIRKGVTTISRTFGLLPDTNNKEEEKEVKKKLKRHFIKVRELKNTFVEEMIKDARENGIENYKGNSIKDAYSTCYRLGLNEISANQYSSYHLSKMTKICASYDAYFVARNWIIRKENLVTIIDGIIDKLQADWLGDFALKFLKGDQFKKREVDFLLDSLTQDCFGYYQNIALNYLDNHIKQVRNLLFSQFDFLGSQIHSPETEFQEFVINKIENLTPNSSIIKRIANGFTKTENKERVKIPEEELAEYFLKRYCIHLKRRTLRMAKEVIASRGKIEKLQKKEPTPKVKRSIQKNKNRIQSYLRTIKYNLNLENGFNFTSIEDFKEIRDSVINPFKEEMVKELVSPSKLESMVKEQFFAEKTDILTDSNKYILRRIFKPSPLYFKGNLSKIEFHRYIRTRFQNKVRYNFREFIYSYELRDYFVKKLREIKRNLWDTLKIPEFKTLTFRAYNQTVFKANHQFGYDSEKNPIHDDLNKKYSYYKVDLDLVDGRSKLSDELNLTLRVKDGTFKGEGTLLERFNNRINQLIENGFKPSLPTFTFNNRKLRIHIPFQQEKEELSNYSKVKLSGDLVMGVDLGLKHFAVISIWNVKTDEEVARYFLGQEELFDKKFDPATGKIVLQEKFRDENGELNGKNCKKSNVKRTLINLRREIEKLQRMKSEYEDRHPNFKEKLKWSRLSRELTYCWARLNRLNKQIIRYLNHYTIAIAKYWKVKTIKVEDLGWSSYKKKRDAGSYLAFWRIQWFFSQVQSAVELQCKINKIGFKKVRASYTSQDCCKCGARGTRDGKTFTCKNSSRFHSIPFQIDADLNAARVIAGAQS